ncbi:FAD-binding oxidoreductase [Nisaea acidiphila]|uniref:FAD-binding oxidoreductase n=1 Tax=Nisaea acidiphila TaxID=1862145 RepID=A0A9J7B0C5_9PROT|nr:FAD-binding oxidoreductase [Nisaea acidiphila]UUX51141.1 FAD-binding oxidoreductase [Nisaea acidiphila]
MSKHIIVGGGVYGAAVAWHLASRGEAVELIEAGSIASGASGGPGRRGVRANGRDQREIPLMVRAREIWPALHETLDTDPLFETTGQIQLFEREVDLAPMEVRAALQTRLGIESRVLGHDEVREFEPEVAPMVRGGLYCPGDGVAFHKATTLAYAAKARAAGAVLREGVAAARLIEKDGRVSAVQTADGEEIPVEGKLLLFCNAGVKPLVAPWIDLPLWSRAFLVAVSAPLAHNPVRHLVGHASRTLSLKREPDGRLMISGGRPGRWDYVTGRGTPIQEEVDLNVADAVAVYPSLDGLEVETADTDHLEAECIDKIPVIDSLPGNEHVLYAAGWTGHGWAIAPAVAELMRDWVLDGTKPRLLEPFAFGRFG